MTACKYVLKKLIIIFVIRIPLIAVRIKVFVWWWNKEMKHLKFLNNLWVFWGSLTILIQPLVLVWELALPTYSLYWTSLPDFMALLSAKFCAYNHHSLLTVQALKFCASCVTCVSEECLVLWSTRPPKQKFLLTREIHSQGAGIPCLCKHRFFAYGKQSHEVGPLLSTGQSFSFGAHFPHHSVHS